MSKYSRCPNCGHKPASGSWRKVYKCSKCGNVHCSNCGSTKCPKCGSASRYQVSEIYG
jgi:hypothetical protein